MEKAEQEFDLFKGINDYYEESPNELLEFYPFKGIEFNERMTMKKLKDLFRYHFETLPIYLW